MPVSRILIHPLLHPDASSASPQLPFPVKGLLLIGL